MRRVHWRSLEAGGSTLSNRERAWHLGLVVPALLGGLGATPGCLPRAAEEPISAALLAGIAGGGVAAAATRGRRPRGALLGSVAAGGLAFAFLGPGAAALGLALVSGLALGSVDVAARPGRAGSGDSAWGWGERWDRFAFAGGPRPGAGAVAGSAWGAWTPARRSARLDACDRLELERMILEAARPSRGDLVVAMVRACEDDARLAWRTGVWLAAVVSLGIGLSGLALPAWGWVGLAGGALAVGGRAGRMPSVRRLLLSPARRTERAERRARRAFAEAGLARAPARAGVLIFVALLERRVVVLAGEGIHALLAPDESWETVVSAARTGFEAGDPRAALEAAARRAGEILCARLPAEPRPLHAFPPPLLLIRDDA